MTRAVRNRLLAVILLVVGLGTALWYGPSLILEARASRDWPTTTGEVLESGVARVSKGTGTDRHTAWEPRIRYRYEVDGRTFTSDRVWVGGGRSRPDRGWAEEIASRYAAGSTCSVYHDPDDPARAILLHGAETRAWMTAGFGVALVVVGLVFLRRG